MDNTHNLICLHKLKNKLIQSHPYSSMFPIVFNDFLHSCKLNFYTLQLWYADVMGDDEIAKILGVSDKCNINPCIC